MKYVQPVYSVDGSTGSEFLGCPHQSFEAWQKYWRTTSDGRKHTLHSVHLIEFDLNAGFQTINITQLNADGSRQDEEYLRHANEGEQADREIPQYTGPDLA